MEHQFLWPQWLDNPGKQVVPAAGLLSLDCVEGSTRWLGERASEREPARCVFPHLFDHGDWGSLACTLETGSHRQESVLVKDPDFIDRGLSPCCHVFSEGLWAGHPTSLSLSFLSCKEMIILAPYLPVRYFEGEIY